MKKIILKKVHIDYGDEGLKPEGSPEFLDYRITIMGLLKTPKDPAKGADFEETAEAMPIWHRFRKLKLAAMGDNEILLEDAEHKFVLGGLKNARYVQRSFELYEMIVAFENAPDHLVVEKSNA